MSRQINTLKRVETLAVYDWMKEHRAEVETMRAAEAAEAVGKAKGIYVTESSMRALAKDAGIILSKHRPYRRATPPTSPNKRLAFLASQIYALSKIVFELHQKLGAEFPIDRINVAVLKDMRLGRSAEVNGKVEGFHNQPEE